MARQSRIFVGSCVATLAITMGCAGAGPRPSPPPDTAPPLASSAAASTTAPLPASPQDPPVAVRYVPGRRFVPIGDGQRGAVVAGRRVVFADGHERVVGATVSDLSEAHRIPAAFGGGWLFVGAHTVSFAAAFDAPLVEIRKVEEPTPRLKVGVGWSQVLISSEHGAPTLHELPSGRAVKSPVRGLVELFAVPSGFVMARTVAGEMYVSKDKATPFKKARLPRASGITYDGETALVEVDGGYLGIGPDGGNGPTRPCSGCTITSGLDALDDPYPNHAAPPLPDRELAFARRMNSRVAWSTDQGALQVFDIATGKKTTIKKAFAGRYSCAAIWSGTPSFAVCNATAAAKDSPAEPLTVYRVDGGGAPVEDHAITRLLSHDWLGLPSNESPPMFAARCDGTEYTRAFCVRQSDGTWADVAMPPDPGGLLEKMALKPDATASAAGEPYLIGWLHEHKDLLIVDGRASKLRVLTIPRAITDDIRRECVHVADGTLRFPLKEGGILEITPDDKFSVQKIEGKYSICGARGLRARADGKLGETLDGGKTFHDVDSPPDGLAVDFLSCGEVGCETGAWIRIGWGEAARK